MIDRAIVYFLDDRYDRCDLMTLSVRSCRRHAPHLPVIQISPPGTEKHVGVDAVYYHDLGIFAGYPWNMYAAKAAAHDHATQFAFVHADVVILRDFDDLFDRDADVVLPLMDEPERMPAYPAVRYHFSGFIVSRSVEFWRGILQYVLSRPGLFDNWRAGVCSAALHDWLDGFGAGFKVSAPDGMMYVPNKGDKPERWRKHAALHYEARRRKSLMLEHWG